MERKGEGKKMEGKNRKDDKGEKKGEREKDEGRTEDKDMGG